MVNFDENIIPSQPTIQYHEFKCCRCGVQNGVIKPESFIDWERETKIYKKILNDVIHEINEIMAFSELHYNMNPQKEKLIKELMKIRDKYSEDS